MSGAVFEKLVGDTAALYTQPVIAKGVYVR